MTLVIKGSLRGHEFGIPPVMTLMTPLIAGRITGV